LINGIDSRCWPGGAPDPVPVLWLKPEDLTAIADGDGVLRWKDSSVYENHAIQPDPEFRPVKGNDGTWDYAGFEQHLELSLAREIRVSNAWGIFMVVYLGDPDDAVFQFAAINPIALTVRPTRWDYQHGVTINFFPIGGNPSLLMLMGLRRMASYAKTSLI